MSILDKNIRGNFMPMLNDSFFVAPPVVLTDQSAKAELVRKFAKQT